MAQLMPLPLTISCSSEIEMVLVLAYLGNPGQSPEGRKMDVCVKYWFMFSMFLTMAGLLLLELFFICFVFFIFLHVLLLI